jgi:hypothetical protein
VLPGSDRGPQPGRYLIAIHCCDLGGIEHRLDAYLTSAAAEKLGQLVEGEWAAVVGPHQRLPGTQRRLREVEMQHHSGPGRLSGKPGRHRQRQ